MQNLVELTGFLMFFGPILAVVGMVGVEAVTDLFKGAKNV